MFKRPGARPVSSYFYNDFKKRGGGRAFSGYYDMDKRGGGRAFSGYEKRGGGRAFSGYGEKRGGGRAFGRQSAGDDY